MPKIINHHNFYFILLIIVSLIIFLIQLGHPPKELNYNEEKVKIWEVKSMEFNSKKKLLDMGDFSNKVIPTKSNNKKVIVDKLAFEYLVPRREYGLKPLAYLSTYNDDIVIATGDGIFFHTTLKDIYKKNILSIPSNFREMINFREFYEPNWISIKDISIIKNKIYLSFTNQKKNLPIIEVSDSREYSSGCFNIELLEADFNTDYLKFSKFFEYDDCVDYNQYGDINLHQSGGKILKLNDSEIVLSIGDFRNRYLAQNDDSIFGKIISINVIDKSYKLLSKGHRNIQGINFIDNKNLIVSEHGPKGGDEINIINLENNKRLPNYGWPISSYGEHYDGIFRPESPLYKSHKKHSFVEPLKYFTPSIAPSEILFSDNQIILGSMGYNPDLNHMGIHLIQLNESKNIILEDFLPLNDRVRDLVFTSNKEYILGILETNPALLIIKNQF